MIPTFEEFSVVLFIIPYGQFYKQVSDCMILGRSRVNLMKHYSAHSLFALAQRPQRGLFSKVKSALRWPEVCA